MLEDNSPAGTLQLTLNSFSYSSTTFGLNTSGRACCVSGDGSILHTLAQQCSKNRRGTDNRNQIIVLIAYMTYVSSRRVLNGCYKLTSHMSDQDNPKGISASRAALGLARVRSDTFPNPTSKAADSYFGPWPWMCQPAVPQLFSFGSPLVVWSHQLLVASRPRGRAESDRYLGIGHPVSPAFAADRVISGLGITMLELLLALRSGNNRVFGHRLHLWHHIDFTPKHCSAEHLHDLYAI